MSIVDLSILVCSVSDRYEEALELGLDLVHQASPYGTLVEVLILTDNRCRTIGMKRQALLDISQGGYVCFVDDDDEVHEEFVKRIMSNIIAEATSAHVLTFPTLCASKEFGTMLVHHDILYRNENPKMPSFKRKPWFMHPIRRDIAVSSRFTDKNWGEDADWLNGIWPKLTHQTSISLEPLYQYNWNDKKGAS